MRYWLVILFLFSPVVLSATTGRTLVVYHDAEYTSHLASAQAMSMGFNTALSEVNHQIQGYSIKLVAKDHRGNAKRSKLHMQQLLADPDALFMLGGLHSPPYIGNRDFINQNGLLLLVPWAAAGPITRYRGGPNWVFRVSIDDSKAGYRIAQFALDVKQCKSPHLLLENTGWGRTNHQTLSEVLKQRNTHESGVTWFEWNTKKNVARIQLREIIRNSSDCIIFVGNSLEGKVYAKAMASLDSDRRLPIISHWGITGGAFNLEYKKYLHNKIDLSFIQTCFSFLNSNLNPLANKVIETATHLYPELLQQPEDLPAPPGFIHAYDLGKIFLAALNQISLTGDMVKDRELLREALEHLKKPVQGLLKIYSPPFSPWSTFNEDAHEALGLEDLCMANFDVDGIIHVIDNESSVKDRAR